MTKIGQSRLRRLLGDRLLPLAVAVAAAAGGAGLVACGSGGDEEAPAGRQGRGPGGGGPGGFGGGPPGAGGGAGTAVPVEVAEIVTGEIAAFIETNGALEAEREVDIVARIGGPLVDLRTEEGMRVSAGQLLAQVDEAEARAQVEIARVALQQAELALGRAKASFENAVVSQEVYDTAVSNFDSARAQLEGSEIQHGYTRIEAPFSGLIVERAVKFGETVTNGQRLFRISDFDPLLCTIGVPERDLSRLSVGQSAVIEVEAFPGERFRGRVLRVSPVVEAATGTIRVTLEVDRDGRLSPGMFATVRLVTDVRENALIMPKRALSLESLADSVFVVEDGVAYRRNITLGYEEDERVEVTSGLGANDRVIVVGQDGLTDVTPVQILAGPGAEEPSPRRAATGAAGGMSEEIRTAIAERMRARGMTEEQIATRLEAVEAGGGAARGLRGGSPAGAGSGGGRPAAGTPGGSRGGPGERGSRGAGGDAGPPDRSAPEAGPGERTPEQVEAFRRRLREQGLTEEQIEARLARRPRPEASR